MDWVSFGSGCIVAALFLVLFSQGREDYELELDEGDYDDDVDIHDFRGRTVVMGCITCRKKKKHREVEPNLYQCVKCKRPVDLRRTESK